MYSIYSVIRPKKISKPLVCIIQNDSSEHTKSTTKFTEKMSKFSIVRDFFYGFKIKNLIEVFCWVCVFCAFILNTMLFCWVTPLGLVILKWKSPKVKWRDIFLHNYLSTYTYLHIRKWKKKLLVNNLCGGDLEHIALNFHKILEDEIWQA